MKHLLALTLLISLLACENSLKDNETSIDNSIIGCWIYDEIINDSVYVFHRSDSLITNSAGYQFFTGDSLIMRTSGWCGTPPISYYNIKNMYSISDSILTMYTFYTSMQVTQTWRIIDISNTELLATRNYFYMD